VQFLRFGDGRRILSQFEMVYDQLAYPLIFWNGHGGRGAAENEELQKIISLIRTTLISLALQKRSHFIHQFPTLRDEFICAGSGRIVNMSIQFHIRSQKTLGREDEMRIPTPEGSDKEYGLRNFIPPSVTDTDEYWHSVANKCFAISTHLGTPMFFPTFTMNPCWPEYQALKGDSGNFADSANMAIVFKYKLSALMQFLTSKAILGKILGFVWSIKYQKRGLPHALRLTL
jgi:hypothetical protein